jgi:hypothetical protein
VGYLLLVFVTLTLARPPLPNEPMMMRYCGRALPRAIDEVCLAVKSPPAFIDPLALNQSSLGDESGLFFLSISYKKKAALD